MKFLNWLTTMGTKSYKRSNGKRATFVKPGFRRGTWGMIGAAAVGGGLGIAGSMMGGDDSEGTQLLYEQLPGYEESDAARKDMWGRLQEWGALPGYGAISPDWGDIWERAKGKVGRYYWGGPGETGLAGKVKASAARRGVSDSPALESMLTRMGQQEGIQLGEMGTEQALQEALFGERGRQNWFGQMQGLASMKPAYTSTGSITTGQGASTGQLIGDLGSAAGGAFQQAGQNKWMQNYLQEMLGQSNLGIGGYSDPTGGYNVGYGPSAYPGGYAPS